VERELVGNDRLDGVRGLGIEVSVTWRMQRRSPEKLRRRGFGRREIRGKGRRNPVTRFLGYFFLLASTSKVGKRNKMGYFAMGIGYGYNTTDLFFPIPLFV
jgi:hypothetical protein